MEFSFLEDKRGLSAIISMVIGLVLVVSLAAVVMNTVFDTVEEKTEKAESCGANLIGSLSINSEWTCYDQNNGILNVQIKRKDVDLDSLTVSVSTGWSSYNFDLSNTSELSDYKDGEVGIYAFDPSGNMNKDPKIVKKGYSTNYLIGNFSEKPSRIRISPTIKENQCRVLDKVNQIADCSKISEIDLSS